MTARIIMPRTLATRAPYGSLLKPPRIDRSAQRKQFRASGPETDPAYLALIRQCPCMRCGLDPAGIAAHVRMNSAALGKRQAIFNVATHLAHFFAAGFHFKRMAAHVGRITLFWPGAIYELLADT